LASIAANQLIHITNVTFRVARPAQITQHLLVYDWRCPWG
jgi:hypothetical protein